MIKIKDNVDSKELEEYGYIKHNNKKALVDYYKFGNNYVINIYKDKTVHISFSRPYNEMIKENDEIIYSKIKDLIGANLVEKSDNQ